MKLPGINYTTAVGPDISSLPLQEARAWSNAADNWATAIDNVATQMAEAQGEEAALTGIQQMDLEEQKILFNPQWNVQKLGEPPSEIQIETRNKLGKQPVYQTHEFAGALYDHSARRITEEATKGLSGKAKRIATQKLTAHSIRRRAHVLENQFKAKRDYAKGVRLNQINTLTAQATLDNLEDTVLQVNEAIAGGVQEGTILMVEAENMRVKALDEATHAAVIDQVRRAGSDAELDAIEAGVFNQNIGGQQTRMSSGKLASSIRAIDQRRTALDREEDDRHKDNFRFAAAGVMRGDIAQADIPDLLASNALSAQMGLTLYKLSEAEKPTEATFKDQTARNYWAGQIRRLRYGVGQTETLRERNVRLQKDINAAATGAYADGTPYQGKRISETDAAWALEQLDKQYNKVLSHPELKEVLSSIRTWTGMDGIVDIDESSNNRKAQLAFNRAAWAYYDRMTVDADMREWFEQNKAAYDPENFTAGGELGRLQGLGVPGHLQDFREIARWVDSSEAAHLPPERLQAIKETLVPLYAPDVEEEARDNAMDATGLTEAR